MGENTETGDNAAVAAALGAAAEPLATPTTEQQIVTEAKIAEREVGLAPAETAESQAKTGKKKGEKKEKGGEKKEKGSTAPTEKKKKDKKDPSQQTAASDKPNGEQTTSTEQKKGGGEKKKGQQKPPPAPQLLFHESLGKELTQKFSDITNSPVRRPSVASYFATGIIEEQVQHDIKATVVTTVQKTVVVEPANTATTSTTSAGAQQQQVESPKTPEAVRAVAAEVDALTSPKHEFPFATPAQEGEEQSPTEKKSVPGKMYSLRDMNAFQTIESLVARFGRMTHMGVRDHNYDFFLNKSKTGVISYRLIDDKVAVISGDPICAVPQYRLLLSEFSAFCKHNRWQWSIQGASAEMAEIAKVNGWTTVQYGRERALNVQTNPVLLGSEGKRIRTQCKQLQKTVNVGIYCPAYTRDAKLEAQIVEMYDNWRLGRNTTRMVQAYVTVFDMLSLHRLMIYVYTHDAAGKLLGFAALRRLRDGYHVDPITVDPDAPRGMTDLLLIASMALLKESNVSRLVLGVEPLDELGEITGMSKALERLTRKSHKLISAELPLGGKKGFNDRFRPEDAFEEKLFMIYPNSPSIKQSVAMAHFANIHLHDAVKQRVAREREKRRRNSDPEVNAKPGESSTNNSSTENLAVPYGVAYNPVGIPVIQQRPRSAVRHNSDGAELHRRDSDEQDKLAPPKQRGRASSRIRFFRRTSAEVVDERSIGEALTSLSPQEVKLPPKRESEDNLAVRPGLHHKHSSSRLRLFRRGSDEAPEEAGKHEHHHHLFKTHEHQQQRHGSEQVGLDGAAAAASSSSLAPPTTAAGRERSGSKSGSRIKLFSRGSDEVEDKHEHKSEQQQRHSSEQVAAQDGGLLAPPGREQAGSRSSSRIRLFRRKSSEGGARAGAEGALKHAEPMPLVG